MSTLILKGLEKEKALKINFFSKKRKLWGFLENFDFSGIFLKRFKIILLSENIKKSETWEIGRFRKIELTVIKKN